MYYAINGRQMPAPVSFDPEVNALYGENTGRDESGMNHLDLIRGRVHKWQIKHTMLTEDQMRSIVEALDPKGFNFTGMSTLGQVSCSAYAASINATAKTSNIGPGGSHYWDLSFNVIEN